MAAGASAREVVAAAARQCAFRVGLPLGDGAPELLLDVHSGAEPDFEVSPWDLGVIYERALDNRHRHREGVHYTPREVATGLVALALGRGSGQRVCDPAVGGGSFLLAAGEHLAARGVDPAEVVRSRLWGIDVDPVAIEVARVSLAIWGSREGSWVDPGDHLVVADTLIEGAGAFAANTHGFEVVVGNPPFQSQLLEDTARTPQKTQQLRDRWCAGAGPYADSAAFFLLAALELAAEGGNVMLVQPQSLLVAADATAVRERLLADGVLAGLWLGGPDVFAADVAVCAPLIRRDPCQTHSVDRWVGPEVQKCDPAPVPSGETWGPAVADLLGAPVVHLETEGVIGDLCSATAGFRDEFYGLAAHTVDAADGTDPPLVTVGMIDPLRNRWGTGEFRFAGERRQHPRVELATLNQDNSRLARWVAERQQPKLLVATQTKIIEVAVDESGNCVPSTPVIAVVPPVRQLWHVAAALCAPGLAALAFSRVAGAALSSDTIKLSARQILQLPLPRNEAAWNEGASLAKQASACVDQERWRDLLLELGGVMNRAYGIEDANVLQWWEHRLPPWR